MDISHPNALLLEKMYAAFARGDVDAMLSDCADQVTFQLSGKSKLAGKYTKADFGSKFVTQLQEMSGGTLQIETHDFLASDRHGIVLATERLTRSGKPVEYRVVHVWRFENGKPVAWYEYLRDQYQYDAIWS